MNRETIANLSVPVEMLLEAIATSVRKLSGKYWEPILNLSQTTPMDREYFHFFESGSRFIIGLQ